MTKRRRSTIRRAIASTLLAAFALSLAAPPLGAGLTVPRDCPLVPPSGAHSPVLIDAMPDGACDHTDAGPCLGALGCFGAGPAIALLPTSFTLPTALLVVALRPAPHFGDLLRTGPPTPPPDRI